MWNPIAFVEALIDTVLWLRHVVVVMWRIEQGRWYVMRDRPTWFLVDCISLAEGKSVDDTVIDLGKRAQRELDLRIRRGDA